MSQEASFLCNRAEALRDYVFDELPARERPAVEQHLAGCSECAAELDRLRLTTASLRLLPDREIPQRIAFVSDKVFEPSRLHRFFAPFWNSAPRLGFASACVLAIALIFSAYHRPPGVRTVVQQTASAPVDLNRQVNDAVAKAIAQVRAEESRNTRLTLEAAERKHDEEHRALLISMQENLTVLQKRLSTYTMLASADAIRNGAGQ